MGGKVMNVQLAHLIQLAGGLQLSVLIASVLVPVRLHWKSQLAGLPRLVRQLFWVYGGYVVLSIVSLGSICLINARELAHGSMLARSVCGYMAIFWGIRLALQLVLEAAPFLTAWWLKAGYHVLTVLFASFAALFLWAACRPVG
jgi:hypothetical protein